MGYQTELGSLDPKAVERKFEWLQGKMLGCVQQAASRIEFLGGEVKVFLRIKEDGTVRWAYLKDSTLGDHATERCMLEAVRGTTWPRPIGGEGLADNSYSFPAGGDRPPVEWTGERIAGALKDARTDLDVCRAGAGPLSVTLYVDTEGKALGVGATGRDENADRAVGCVVEKLAALKYPSPGSWPAKVTFTLE